MTDRLLTSAQAVEYLGIAWTTLRAWRKHGKGPAAIAVDQPGMGMKYHYRRSDLDAFLASAKPPPPRPAVPATPPPWTRLTDPQWDAVHAALLQSPAGARSLHRLNAADQRTFIDQVLAAAVLGFWRTWDDKPASVLAMRALKWHRNGLWHTIFRALAPFPDFRFGLTTQTLIIHRTGDSKRRTGMHGRHHCLSLDTETIGPLRPSGVGRALAQWQRSRGKPLPTVVRPHKRKPVATAD